MECRSLLAPLANIVDVDPDPRTTPVGQVIVNFTDSTSGLSTNAFGVDIDDFTLTRNGEAVSLTGLNVSGSGDTYSLDLSTVTIEDGSYVLTLHANGTIIDSNGAPMAQDALENFVIDTATPSANIVDISPDPRNIAVGNVAIVFDEEVVGVDISDFSLKRNDSVVSLTGLTVNGSGANYSLNLSTVTGASGTYVLTLNANNSEIRDSVGNPLNADASDSWTTDATAPTAEIVAITPDPRNTAVGAVTIQFSESVSGVDINDFTLTRNGTNVSLAGLTVSGSGANYTLNLSTVTAAAGTYVLTLNASGSGITDGLGNALAANASDTWVNDTTAPTADIVDVTPDPRSDSVEIVTINFSEQVTGVDINDFELKRNGAEIDITGLTVNGSGKSYTIDLEPVTGIFGSYTLTLNHLGSEIKDLAGNELATDAADSWLIDDVREQNDTLRTAHELGRLTGRITIEHLGLVDSNDWFRFTMAAKGGPTDKVTITFQNAAGDLNLQLLNVSGQILRSSTGTSNSETISLSGRPAGTYYIRVFGKNGAINPDYTLTVAAPVVLADDAYEQNDSRSSARNLGTPISPLVIPRLVMLDSHDWYRFRTLGPGTSADFVSINFLNAQGNLDLELYDASGRRLATSTGTASGQQISLNGRAAGTYFVHVLGVGGARNPDYTLQIDPPTAAAATPDTTFSVQLLFSGLTASQIAIFQQAAAKWQSIITSDLPNLNYFRAGFTGSVAVDDLLIEAGAVTIDGSGNVLGRSAPDSFRSGSGLPYHGIMQFDKADLATMEANGTLLSAVEHEMAHILGFGSLWASKGLLINSGTANVAFTGAQGIAAYNSVFSTTATSVPVENTGGAGTANSHWRESVFGNELMTGFLNSGVFNPLSRVTIASMADLGYSVNLGAADAYSPPTTTSSSGGTLLVGGTSTGSNVAGTGDAAAVDALLADWPYFSSSLRKPKS